MSENLGDSPGEDRTERIGDPPPGHPRPGHPTPGHAMPDHTVPGHAVPGHAVPGHTMPGQSVPPPGQGYGQPGQGYPSLPYDPSDYRYQSGYQDGYAQYGGYGRPAGYGHQAPPGTYGPRPGSDDTTMAMLAHLLGLLTSFVGPLVLYLAKKDESPYVRDQAAEALNFQLTVLIAYFVCTLLALVLIGFVLMFLLWIGSIIMMVIAAVAANRGENHRYPMSIRFVS
ncbi:DUF4870 domain-containing protein [Streptosporangium amethystogenes]|uniref:DUF4870 domain-containing protein n=1 Tax=Streptosporangium amethystogenes TaxID=2002 RepID=UPI0037943734